MQLVRKTAIGMGRLLDRLRQTARRRRGVDEHLLLAEKGEDWAQRFVQELGWTVVARNYRKKSGRGEIDLVAVEDGTLVFVEVKTRSSAETGTPERAVHPEKQRLLGRTAEEYMRFAEFEGLSIRFDIITIVMGERKTQVEYFRDAFYPVRPGMRL